MKLTSIKAKVLLLVLVSTFVSFAILGFYNAKNQYSSQYELIKDKEISLTTETSKFINSYLQSKIDIVEGITKVLPKDNFVIENKKMVEKLVLGKEAGGFADVYIGFEKDGALILADGTILNVPKDNYDARTRPWYKNAVSTKKSGISEPYVDVSTKKLVVSVYTPFIADGKVLGVIGSDIFITTVVEAVLNVKIYGMGVSYLVNKDGKIIIHEDQEMLEKMDVSYPQIKSDKKVGFGETIENDHAELSSYGTIDNANWKFILKLDKDEIFEDIDNNIIKEIMMYIALLFIILGIILYSLIKILSPLKTLSEGFDYFFRYLKGDETNIKSININTNDEFGNMAKTINSQMKNISIGLEQDKKLIEEVKQVVSRVNEGNFDLIVKNETSNKALNELKDILNEMIEVTKNNVDVNINTILESLEKYSQLNFVDDIKNPTGKISRGLNNLASIINEMLRENRQNGLTIGENSKILLSNVDILNKSSNDTAASLEETAAALEEITSTIIHTTDNVQQMANYSQELTQSIKVGQELANTTVDAMNEINTQTEAIAEAITVIDQIAFQTNILSLNAAVEAATAGEAGKGFAVVAQEVRNLASRSAEAAKEIKDIVEIATNKTAAGKQSADKMILGYEELNSNIIKTTQTIDDISKASNEQKVGIEQINDAVTKLDQQTQQNASVATQTHDIAVGTADIAKQILDDVNKKQFK